MRTINRLEELGDVIKKGNPTEVLYGLGKGSKRTELQVTHVNGSTKISNRIASSPRFRLYRGKREILMDITDSDEDADCYTFRGLKPNGVDFEPPKHEEYDLGCLVIGLDGDNTLAISHALREA